MTLLERQSQLDELTLHLSQAANGTGNAVFISGEAGAGKSVLVEHFATSATRTARAVWGHSDPLETSRVLGPVSELLAALSLTTNVHGDASPPREQIFLRLLERLSPPNPPTLVVLEDLHWADEATLDFVRFLGRRIQRTRCLLVATYRDDELVTAHPLRRVLGELVGRHIARLRIPPLSLNAVQELAKGTRRNARKVHEVSGGNAFFVRELLSAPLTGVPETVRDAVLARLMKCSESARELTELVSLLPGRAASWLTRSILGDVGAAAEEAVACGLLKQDEDSLAFRHELGRLAVAGAIPRSRAQTMHLGILRKLIQHEADLSQLVHHALHAQDVRALLEYAPKAAQQAARVGAHREAAAHLATALKHADSLDVADRAHLLELHAIECDLTNDVTTAIASGKEAYALREARGEVAHQARVLLLLERQYWKAGQNVLAEEHVARAIALLEAMPPRPELAMAYSSRARLAMTSDRAAEALEFGERALELAEQFGDQGVRAHATNNIGAALLVSGDQKGIARLEESLAISLEHNLQRHVGRAYANLVSGSVRQHLFSTATRYIAEALEYCEIHEVEDCFSYVRAYQAHLELTQGRWDSAAQIVGELLETHTLALSQKIPALLALALIRLRRGDPGADALLEEAMQLALPTRELQRIGPVAAARAEIAWYHGDLERVSKEACLALDLVGDSRDPWVRGELVYWARQGDSAVAVPTDIAEPYALMIAGEWERAAAIWKEIGAPYHRALALTAGPVEALREALAIASQLGAGSLSALVRQRLRDRGVQSTSRGPRASTRGNPAGLTTREVQVLALLVKGHTNSELARRLHISAKTVDHHVSAILQKLDARTRTEAVAAALGLGIVRGSP